MKAVAARRLDEVGRPVVVMANHNQVDEPVLTRPLAVLPMAVRGIGTSCVGVIGQWPLNMIRAAEPSRRVSGPAMYPDVGPLTRKSLMLGTR